jgi:hypothetical protein
MLLNVYIHVYILLVLCLYFFWFCLWCLTPFSTIFQLYLAVSFIGGGNRRNLSDKGFDLIWFFYGVVQKDQVFKSEFITMKKEMKFIISNIF